MESIRQWTQFVFDRLSKIRKNPMPSNLANCREQLRPILEGVGAVTPYLCGGGRPAPYGTLCEISSEVLPLFRAGRQNGISGTRRTARSALYCAKHNVDFDGSGRPVFGTDC